MGVDVTDLFRGFIKEKMLSQGHTENEIKEMISKTIFPEKKIRSPITQAAYQIKQSMKETKKLINSNKQKYIMPGIISKDEYNEIEKEVIVLTKTCSDKIDELSGVVAKLQSDYRRVESGDMITEQAIAHFHGMVLILSEELREVVMLFDKCRLERRKNEMAIERRRSKQMTSHQQKSKITTETDASNTSPKRNITPYSKHQQQELIDEENKAIFEHLTTRYDQVKKTSKTLEEIATLNQMLTTEILSQVEKIERIYMDAVQSSTCFVKGNEQLDKAVKMNSDSTFYIVLLIVLATFILLYFDWFYG